MTLYADLLGRPSGFLPWIRTRRFVQRRRFIRCCGGARLQEGLQEGLWVVLERLAEPQEVVQSDHGGG